MADIEQQVLPLLAPAVRSPLSTWSALAQVEEIRLRIGAPLELVAGSRRHWLSPAGSGLLTREHIEQTLHLLSQYSYYAYSGQFAQGYITVAGGHRVGVAGRTVVEQGKVAAMTDIGSLNFRIARSFPGCGEAVIPWLRQKDGIANTLLLAPPRGGKTTLLRELVRLFSDELGLTVGLVDERSEVAGCFRGVPQLDVGRRTDVLDACPKDQGLIMLIRSMGPQVVAADEIGRPSDVAALEYILSAGTAVVTTAHATGPEDAARRPALGELLAANCFSRLVVLGRRKGIPALAGVLAWPEQRWLYRGDGM